jgi:polar amino acid transport system substrate-binding protein
VGAALQILVFIRGFLTLALVAATAAFADETDPPTLEIMYYQRDGGGLYIDSEGRATGYGAEKVAAFFGRRNVSYIWKVMPWSRLYRTAHERDNAVIYNLLRTPERENNFHWFLKIRDEANFLMTRNTPEMTGLTMQDILAGDYRALCDQDAAQCVMFRKLGFPEDRIVQVQSGVDTGDLARLVLAGRADFIIENAEYLAEELTQDGLPLSSMIELIKLSSTPTYLAAPKNFNEKLLMKLQP